MANNYFAFKQFTIYQDKTAMKVGSDGVLLGVLADIGASPVRIMDIGTGTGLVALMLAQRCPSAMIDAVEIDADAALQANENFSNSPFRDRLSIIHADVNSLDSCQYDLVVSNPPYFVDSLLAPDKQRTMARHAVTLTYHHLAESVSRLLSSHGRCSVIIPSDTSSSLEREFSQCGLNVVSRVHVKPNLMKPPKRVVLTFGRGSQFVVESELVMDEAPRKRTPQFDALVRDFYLDK